MSTSTPVLTKKQQKHTLSAKKAPVKGLRNVLAQPQDGYWPMAATDKCTEVEDLLKKLTPALKRPVLTIPWSQLKHLKKEERAQAKKALLNEEQIPDKKIVDSVVMGINAVTRSLEKSNVCCTLLDADIDPPLLVKHIIIMARNKNIPILLLPSLKSVTLNTIGYASAAFALKNLVMESVDHHFHPLYSSIYNIFKDIPLPKNSLQLFKDTDMLEESILCDDSEKSDATVLVDKPTVTEKYTLSETVYKYRSSCKDRAFIPPGTKGEPSIEKMESDDIISISNYAVHDENTVNVQKNTRYMNIHGDTHTTCVVRKNSNSNFIEIENTPTRTNSKTDVMKLKTNSKVDRSTATYVKYLPLKVKRLQGNANRVKATKVSKQKKK